MSWSASYSDAEAFVKNVPSFESPTGVTTEPGHIADQVAAARAAAAAIIESGAVGDTSRDFHVSINGHSNPEHAPTPGWANDCITVSVSQKSAS